MLKVRTKYSPGSCDYAGNYQEVRWDFSGCNLQCLFCWSPASRPAVTEDPARTLTTREVVTGTIQSLRDKSRAFIRFTGGEPTLQWFYLNDALTELPAELGTQRPPILIQTNGIEIGKGTARLDTLRSDPSQCYLFELSFKGTNRDEFALLTGKPAELFEQQVAGYQKLLDVSRASPNVRVVAVLGIYHSSIRGLSKYAFVNPRTGRLLFDDPGIWDPAFATLCRSAPLKWVEPLRMSPLGVWRNVLNRCGPSGANVLRHYPSGIPTNRLGLFPAKPKSADYARQIVTKRFWR